jgi:integrase
MEQQVSQRTIERYTELLEKHAFPYFNKLALGQISPLHVNNLYNTLRESGWQGPRPKKGAKPKGLSPRTVNHVHRVLSACFKAAVALRVIGYNPTADVKRPKIKKTAANKSPKLKMKILAREQLIELLNSADEIPADAILPGIMLRLALDSGARPGEYLVFRWNDVDYPRRGVRIDEALENTKADGLGIKEELKTEQSRRFVTLSAGTLAALSAEQKRQAALRKELGRNDPGDDDLIFAASPAEPYKVRNPDYVSKAFKRLAKRLGFIGLRLYDMRHNCASHMLAAGRPVTEVAAHLGHADAATTLKFYGFAIPKKEPGPGLLDGLLSTVTA